MLLCIPIPQLIKFFLISPTKSHILEIATQKAINQIIINIKTLRKLSKIY